MINPTDTQAIDRAVAELHPEKYVFRKHFWYHKSCTNNSAIYSPSTNHAQAWELMEEILAAGFACKFMPIKEDGMKGVLFQCVKSPKYFHARSSRSETSICLCYIAFKKEQANA